MHQGLGQRFPCNDQADEVSEWYYNNNNIIIIVVVFITIIIIVNIKR